MVVYKPSFTLHRFCISIVVSDIRDNFANEVTQKCPKVSHHVPGCPSLCSQCHLGIFPGCPKEMTSMSFSRNRTAFKFHRGSNTVQK